MGHPAAVEGWGWDMLRSSYKEVGHPSVWGLRDGERQPTLSMKPKGWATRPDRRSFDCVTHDKAVSHFAQDDNFRGERWVKGWTI
jgi:hypothetical protein